MKEGETVREVPGHGGSGLHSSLNAWWEERLGSCTLLALSYSTCTRAGGVSMSAQHMLQEHVCVHF